MQRFDFSDSCFADLLATFRFSNSFLQGYMFFIYNVDWCRRKGLVVMIGAMNG